MIGVYQLRNTTNGKCYIGQSENIAHRLSCHRYDLQHGRHRVVELQKDYDKGDVIVFEVLCECNPNELDRIERLYIQEYTDLGISYNVSPGKLPTGGNEWADESRVKLSKSKAGNKSMVGIRLTDEWRKHLAEAQPHRRRVECIDTGVIYDSVTDAARKTGASRVKITQVCGGTRKSTSGMRFRYVD